MMKPATSPRVVAIIQARMGSRRFPGKMLQRLAGRPLLWHTVTRLRLCRSLNAVALATSSNASDDPLVQFAEVLCIPVIRGPEENVLARFIQAADEMRADVIVRVNGDAPLIDPRLIDQLVDTLIEADADTVGPVPGTPCFHDGVDPLSRRALIKLAREAGDDPLAREHVTGYFKAHPNFVRMAALDVPEVLRVEGPRLSIDTREDLMFFERLYAQFGVAPGTLDVRQVATLYRTVEPLATQG